MGKMVEIKEKPASARKNPAVTKNNRFGGRRMCLSIHRFAGRFLAPPSSACPTGTRRATIAAANLYKP
jgi:hypothetical protein